MRYTQPGIQEAMAGMGKDRVIAYRSSALLETTTGRFIMSWNDYWSLVVPRPGLFA